MSKCKSDAVLVRADAAVAGRANGSAVRSRPYEEVPRRGLAPVEKPRRRPSGVGDDSGEPTVAWAGSKVALPLAPRSESESAPAAAFCSADVLS
mmetsp:Transcript_36876/g.64020  ORF Transcript_36876/g.64020 Transcript_36876/m.64020 type:complete len:94 (+) Transcript_36876:3-284(+)